LVELNNNLKYRMDIAGKIKSFQDTLPSHVKLIAVTKTKPDSMIMQAYNAGHKIFGENKAQELAAKYANLPRDIEWHMIGHLQSNKVKYIVPFVHMIHSVDSLSLLLEIEKEAAKHNITIKCLLQLKIASEESKFGLSHAEIVSIIESREFSELKNCRIIGLMGMATYTEDQGIIRTEFRNCKKIFEDIRNRYFPMQPDFKEISMGMSDDYKIAVEEGSTIVRIGSSIFGERQ
jgi:pyridoxal phosphate enzyme (YggS family)